MGFWLVIIIISCRARGWSKPRLPSCIPGGLVQCSGETLWTFWENVVDDLDGMAAWAFAGWSEVPFVQSADCFSHFGSCSVERYPVFPLQVGSWQLLFVWGFGGLVRVIIRFVPGLELADGLYAWIEAVYCFKALPWFKPSVGVFVAEHWVPVIGFL